MQNTKKFLFALVCTFVLCGFSGRLAVYANEWANYNWAAAARNNDSWYGSAEGRRVADAIVQHQRPDGGWRADMAGNPTGNWANSTLDNNASTSQIIILARAYRANGTASYRNAMNRGIDWLLDGQLPNGGWPQIFGNITTYHRHVTFNDGSSLNAGRIMLEVGYDMNHFQGIVDNNRRERARTALENFVETIINSQIRNPQGRLTAWPQQAHRDTLVPEWGREFEPPAISASESAGIIQFLRILPDHLKCQRVADAHNAAVRWYRDVEINGIRVEQSSDDRWIVNDPNAPTIWARLYRISDNRPIFGDRAQFRPAGVDYRLSLAEISQERRRGYAWYGNWGRNIVTLSDMTPTIVTPPPLLQGTLIRDLNRLDVANATHWSIQNNAQVGDEIFGCRRTFTFTALSNELRGAEWLKMSGYSKDFTQNLATFYAKDAITVYIGLDSRVIPAHGLPSWLSSWTRQTNMEARTNDGTNNIIFEIYSRNFDAGQMVTLGSMGSGVGVMMYTAFITPQETPVFSISLSQTGTLTFPPENVGYGEQTWTPIIVTNTGNRPTGALEINEPTGFSVQGRTGLRSGIAVGATRTFDVRPSRGLAPGTYVETITVSGENGIAPQSFQVSFTVLDTTCETCESDPCICCDECSQHPCICCEDCSKYPCECPPPLLHGRLIENLQRLDIDNIESWSIQDDLQTGHTVYGDRTNIFTSIPDILIGAERLMVAANARVLQSDTVEFMAKENIFVYIGLDSRRNSADLSWLNEWQPVNLTVTANDQTNPEGAGITYNLYRTPLAMGESIRLGTNGAAGGVIMYTVFFTRDYGTELCENCNKEPCECNPHIIFEPNGGEFTDQIDTIIYVEIGESIGILPRAIPSILSREGYRFMGWYEDINDESTRWHDNKEVQRGVTLYAKWVAAPQDFLLGDTNGDGRITSADSVAAARHLASNDANICVLAADLDGDGDVTLSDITLLAGWLVGLNIGHLLANTQ